MKNMAAILFAFILAIGGLILLNIDSHTKDNIGEVASDKPRAEENKVEREISNSFSAPVVSQPTPRAKNPSAVKDYLEAEQLQDAIGDYFDAHEELDDDTRLNKSQEILTQLNNLEKAGDIIPIEALSLRLALLKTTTSETEYPAIAKELTTRYAKLISEEPPEINKAANSRYKERESEILKQVQEMSQYPDGLSRSEYLRQRLQELRAEVYEGSD